jgi:predicted nuclease with RNAse H fold
MRGVLTFGVDLASKDRLTAGCLVDWQASPVVVEVTRPLSDDAIARWARDPGVGVTAIDAPFGWPRAFVDALGVYSRGGVFPDNGGDLWLRTTDHVVWAEAGRRPLSVSSDRIAYPTARAARLLSRLGPGRPAHRDGSDGVIEVYPAAALASWGIDPGRYKQPDGLEVRRSLLSALVEALPGLDVGEHGAVLVATDHAIDALVAALVAGAHMLGQVRRPTEAQAIEAVIEGWIWLPDRPARHLLGATGPG